MKNPFPCLVLLLFTYFGGHAQSHIHAWYQHGQVWIVWKETNPRPEIYEIYSSSTPFTSTHQATLIGKLAHWEWAAGAIKEQIHNPTFNWKVPSINGNYHQLDTTQGLFVFTPHNTDSAYFAVVKRGDTLITPTINGTSSAIQYSYDPVNDPVICHAQLSKVKDGYPTTFWAMWADGQADHWNSRSDFPVMANQYKNGQPSVFIVSEAMAMDTTNGKKNPACIWLHGGDGTAIQSLPNSRPLVNIKPQEGILVAHNDDFVAYVSNNLNERHSNSWFFGWAKSKDPYNPGNNSVTIHDTIVNYTQRRLHWIEDWLIKNYQVDPERIHLNGHSVGSAGTTALMKTYPDRYATATIFNNGLNGHSNSDQGYTLFGDTAWNNPTTLYRHDGSNVQIKQVFNLNDRNSSMRDSPLVRMFHGKNDENGVMMWDAYVVNEYKKADSLGWGMQLYWSERAHGIATGEAYNDHWTHSKLATGQTLRDNVSYEESKYRNKSFPAFYNHRLDSNAFDPGDGTIGTILTGGNGDDWGTYGGYHDWNTTSLIDQPDSWQVCAWLINNAQFANDNCPFDSLVSSISIRKPQGFKPIAGETIYWSQIDSATNTILKEGISLVGTDSIVSVNNIVLYRYPVKTYITFSLTPSVARKDFSANARQLFSIYPNPSQDQLYVRIEGFLKEDLITIRNLRGTTIAKFNTQKENNLLDISNLKAGVYLVSYNNLTLKFIKK